MISAVDILPRHIQTKLVLRPGGQIGQSSQPQDNDHKLCPARYWSIDRNPNI